MIMKDRIFMIDGEIIELTAVAESNGNTLYKFPSDGRITGAPMEEIKKRFPNYEIEPRDKFESDFLFEEEGDLVFYDPDGERVSQYELLTEEDINKI